MHETLLKDEVEQIFQFAYTQIGETEPLQSLKHELYKFHEQLYQPMRVAVVGKIKTGKSTLMNALLGEKIVATGNKELTFNVNWLKYAENQSICVHFKDDAPPEFHSMEQLESLTRRNEARKDFLLRIKYLEVFYPNNVLKSFHLIDTPGLESFFVDDSKNTMDFLGLSPANVDEATQSAARGADAVLFLFNQSLANTDQSLMEEFHGDVLQGASPINAIGILNKIDAYWPSVDSPKSSGEKIARGLMDGHPSVKKLFYRIYPVCGLLAFGAKTLTQQEFETLLVLSKIQKTRFEKLLRNNKRFAFREYDDIPVSSQLRQALLERLGQYGINEAYRLVQSGVNNQEELCKALIELSGFQALLTCIQSHFGNRSFLIKLHNCFKQVKASCFKSYQTLSDTHRKTIDAINGKFEALESNQISFQEFQVLQSYYEGKLKFSNVEAEQLLAVTGEFGSSCWERLGGDENTSLDTLISTAEKYQQSWHNKANDFLDTDRRTIFAASILARSYQRVLFHLKEARRYLYI
ncbi:dynamin family protein [uncultured Desulfobacter sp.]|uniref:dynamin family protein n=1 Tax=uncultured Desulfobacter sp. TaxID=240139 RepID=UPI0029F55523|nr:dynamin family protein [uncultured Desulfobacter sp.]